MQTHLTAACFALSLAALMGTTVVESRALGSSRGLLWDEVNRESNPAYFWLCWSVWAAISLALLGAGIWRACLAALSWDASVAAVAELGWVMKAVSLGLPALVLGGVARKWWRIGRWKPYLAYLRRKYEQRKRLRALTADEDTGVKDLDLDGFLAFADPDWVEDVIAHLQNQAADDRSLKRAIEATSDT